MLARGLHALSRNHPELVLKINLGPARAEGLSGPSGTQDSELKRTGSGAISLAKSFHEAWKLAVWQRRMVARLGDLARVRQKLGQVSTPSCRIVAGAKASDRSPVQNARDLSQQARGLHRPRRPQRLDDLEHQRGVNGVHRHLADDGKHMGAKPGAKLARAFGVLPLLLMLGEVGQCGLLKRHHRPLAGAGFSLLALPLDGVNTVQQPKLDAGCRWRASFKLTTSSGPKP